MSTSVVLVEDGRIGDLTVLCGQGRPGMARPRCLPAGGRPAEIVDCTEVDPMITLAQTRAEVLAVIRFPQAHPHEADEVA